MPIARLSSALDAYKGKESHAITRRGFNRAASRDARGEVAWDFHRFPIIRADGIIDRNARNDSIPTPFGETNHVARVLVAFARSTYTFLIVRGDSPLRRGTVLEPGTRYSPNAENTSAHG